MKLYLDTFVFMDILSANEEFVTDALNQMNQLKTNATGVVSSIVLEELAYHIEKREKDKMDEILVCIKSLPIEIVPVTDEIALLSGKIRAKYHRRLKKLTYHDCIHIATALLTNCDKFVTGDKKFEDIGEIELQKY